MDLKKGKGKKLRRLLLPGLILLLIVGLGLFLNFRKGSKTGYMTVPVTRGDIQITVLANGIVESSNLVSVGAQVSGQVQSLKVDVGDRVTAGQLVAEIDSMPQQNTLKTRTAALTASLAQKEAKEASLYQAQLAYNRQKKMLKGDASSREDFEAAEANLKVLRAEIAALNAEIEQAKIAVDTAQIDLGYTRITSPIDGVVVAIVTKEGQTVNANQTTPTIIKVANLEEMTIKVEISEADVIRIQPGQKVYFSILGEPGQKFPATLESIEPAPESVATESNSTSSVSSTSEAVYYMGTVKVPNKEGKLRISMTTEVNIVLSEAKNVLQVPAAALKGGKGRDNPYTVRVTKGSNGFEERTVKVGLSDNVVAEILEGLQENEQVVIGEQTAATQASESSSQNRRPGPRIR